MKYVAATPLKAAAPTTTQRVGARSKPCCAACRMEVFLPLPVALVRCEVGASIGVKAGTRETTALWRLSAQSFPGVGRLASF